VGIAPSAKADAPYMQRHQDAEPPRGCQSIRRALTALK
jgi:hypothetical protein